MKSIQTKICLAAMVVLLGACAGPKPGTPEFAQKKEADQQKATADAVKQTLSNIPTWFTAPPTDPAYIYQTATAVSPDLQGASDVALLTARRELASKLGDRVSRLITDFATQSGAANNPTLNRDIESVGKQVAADVNLAGYELEKNSFVQDGGLYRAYVLIRYPIGENNKVVVAQVKKNAAIDAKVRKSKAFEELEREIEASKKK